MVFFFAEYATQGKDRTNQRVIYNPRRPGKEIKGLAGLHQVCCRQMFPTHLTKWLYLMTFFPRVTPQSEGENLIMGLFTTHRDPGVWGGGRKECHPGWVTPGLLKVGVLFFLPHFPKRFKLVTFY